jgi:Nuclease-related domain
MVSAAASTTAGALAVVAAAAGATVVAGALLLVMAGLLADARRWLRLAGRSRVGARSEDEVQRALERLEGEGWRLRHSLPWRGRGDIDSVAIAPTGVAFAIETKPERSTRVTWRACERWHCGFAVAGGGGLGAGRFRSCASCAPEVWSVSRAGF